MDVTLVDLSDSGQRRRYENLFEACPWAFIQQSALWADCISEIGPDTPLFLLCSEAGQDLAGLPLYSFKGPSGSILTSVPQPGPLGGIFVRSGLDAPRRERAYASLLTSARALAERQGCLALSLITNPLDDDLALYKSYLRPSYTFQNFTQYIPLDQSVRRSGGQRNSLARARRFGFLVEECRSEEDFAAWCELHRRRHVQLGAVPLDPRLLGNIFRILVPRRKALLLLARDGNRLAAGSLYVHHQKVMDVFAISMDTAYQEHAPNALLADHSQAWATRAGLAVYNWQSSPSRASGVYAYKRQWGSREALYHFVTLVLGPADRIAQLGMEGLRNAYPSHYVAPFGVFEKGFGVSEFQKP